MSETVRTCCSVCQEVKPSVCYLPDAAALCLDCWAAKLKAREANLANFEIAMKRAIVEAKIAVIKEIELKCRKMHEEVMRELESLGLSVEAKVEFLAKNGCKFQAIKLHYDAHGCTLIEAKKYVEDLDNW